MNLNNKNIIIIDYDMGNVGSVKNMIKKIGFHAEISNNVKDINSASHLILPGVGSFDKGMGNLKKGSLIELLNKKVLVEKVPILGICLGMQLFTNNSDEGSMEGLRWIDAAAHKFKFEASERFKQLKIPHMGWNEVINNNNNNLFNGYSIVPRFYFVHSFHVICHNPKNVIGLTKYGYEFSSAIYKDNIIGVQFHPEKSHRFGMQLLKNFINMK